MSSERLFGASKSTTTRTRTVEGGLLCTHAPNSEPRTPNPNSERHYSRAAVRADSSGLIVSTVSSPMFEIRKVFPLIFPYPPSI